MAMDKIVVAERILKIVRNQSSGFGSAKDGISVVAQPQSLQVDATRAIDVWMRKNDNEPIQGFVMLLQTMNILSEEATNTLIDQIIEAS